LLAKNLYLIDNPIARNGDFSVTTSLVNFAPAAQYQQAGLLISDDDDNYMKWTYEANDSYLKDFVGPAEGPTRLPGREFRTSPKVKASQHGDGAGDRDAASIELDRLIEQNANQTLRRRIQGDESAIRGQTRAASGGTGCMPFFVLVAERNGEPTHHIAARTRQRLERVWLRATKRGNVYDFYTSPDGKRFIKQGSTEWGRGGPKKIGLIAQNGGDSDAPGIEAQFDFFELRAH
jgi:hypothetical protein